MNSKLHGFIYMLALLVGVAQPAWGKADRFQPEIPEESVQILEDARDIRRNGDYKRAVNTLKPLLNREPDYFLAHYNLALNYLELGKYESAEHEFSEAKKIRERLTLPEATIYNSFGWFYLIQGKYNEAKENFLKGVQHQEYLNQKSKGKLFHNLGRLYTYEGELQLGEKYLEKAVRQGNKRASSTLKENRQIQEKTIVQKLGDPQQGKKPYFVIVGSFETLQDAKTHAKNLQRRANGRKLEIRLAQNGYYSINWGNPVNYGEGNSLVIQAQESGMAQDAYLYTVKAFGDVQYAVE